MRSLAMELARTTGEDPVVYEPVLGQWFVFGYDEVRAALADDRLTADRMHGFVDRAPPDAVDVVRRHAPWVFSVDGADYEWVRWILHAGLRGAMGQASEAAIASAAHGLLDDLADRDRLDVATEYAFPLSGLILADFLGVDRSDGERLVSWALDLIAFFNDVEITVDAADRMARSAAEMIAYAHPLVSERRGERGGGFLALVAEAAATHGRELDDDTVGNVILPFLTGQIGVAHLTANTVWLLLGHDEQRAKVAADPSLVAGAIAETLRYAPPVMLIPRIALEPVAIGGHVVQTGELIRLDVGAANRDGTRFPDPDRFDVTRPQGGALGFGHGAHSCIGAGLSRMQTVIGVGALLERAPDLELDPEREPVWSAVPGIRGVEGLSLRRPAARAARQAR